MCDPKQAQLISCLLQLFTAVTVLLIVTQQELFKLVVLDGDDLLRFAALERDTLIGNIQSLEEDMRSIYERKRRGSKVRIVSI